MARVIAIGSAIAALLVVGVVAVVISISDGEDVAVGDGTTDPDEPFIPEAPTIPPTGPTDQADPADEPFIPPAPTIPPTEPGDTGADQQVALGGSGGGGDATGTGALPATGGGLGLLAVGLVAAGLFLRRR